MTWVDRQGHLSSGLGTAEHRQERQEGQEEQVTSSVLLPSEEYECNPPHVVAVVAPHVVHGTIEQAQPSTSTEQLLMYVTPGVSLKPCASEELLFPQA